MISRKKIFTLRRFNNILSLIIILLGLYIALQPLLPQIGYLFRDKSPAAIAPYGGLLAEENGNTAPKPIPEDNRIVIPALSLDQPIKEGRDIWVIHDGGTWRRPHTSTPDKGGNTVIVGHRYYASKASTFYSLDKLEYHQKLAVYWEGKEYLYQIESIKVVDPKEIEVEGATEEPTLTLYTCHPLWSAKNRLVITAKLINPAQESNNE